MDIRFQCGTPDGLSGKKRDLVSWYFSFDWHSWESPFVSKLRKSESAQHSPASRDLRRVTQTVGRSITKVTKPEVS